MALKQMTKKSRRVEHKERIIKLCFDSESIKNFQPGLKMLYASEDQPMFINLKSLTLPKVEAKQV